jgi:serine/threonine-protein kinase
MSVTQIGRYRVLRELGRGSGAVVYQGRDPGSGKQVAIKVFFARLTGAEDFAERFDRTLRALRTLEHPALVPVLDYGTETGDEAGEVAYYVVTQYMPGGTLAERMDGRPLLLSEVVPILQRLADGLDAVHGAGLLHGGLDPEQVLFDIRNRAYLADAGLRGLLQGQPAEGALPLPGMPAPLPAGTPAYLSPEQALGEAPDSRSDVYALGVILFEMLTGRQPFQADTAEELLRKHVETPVPALSEGALARLVLPPAFNHVMGRALAKRRDERYPTAGILAEAVRTTFLMPPAERMEATPAAAVLVPGSAPEAKAELAAAAPAEGPAGEAESMVGQPGEPPAAPPGEPPPAEAEATEPAPAEPQRLTVHPVPLSVDPAGLSEMVREPEPSARAPFPLRELAGAGIVLILVLLVLWRWSDVRAIFIAPTATATITQTATATPSVTHTTVPTASATRTKTPTATVTLTSTPSASVTRTATRTPTRTPTATSTNTPRPTLPPFTATLPPTATSSPAPSATATEAAPPPAPPPSDTQAPPPPPPATATPTVTATPTATPTNTPG